MRTASCTDTEQVPAANEDECRRPLMSAIPWPPRRSELQDALYGTRIRAVNHPHNLFAMEARYERKNFVVDSGPVFSGRGSMLRQRYTNGHLEVERGEIENRCWHTQEQHGCL